MVTLKIRTTGLANRELYRNKRAIMARRAAIDGHRMSENMANAGCNDWKRPDDLLAHATRQSVFFNEIAGLADRRERLCKQMNIEKLKCRDCGTRQLQLVAYLNEPARWKCRRCRHVFTKELIEA